MGLRRIKFKARYLLIFLSILILSLSIFLYKISPHINVNVPSPNLKELTTEEKLEDLNYLYNVIKDNYPYLEVSKRKTGYDWLAHKDEFEKLISGTKNNLEFYHSIEEILCLLQNAHTNIVEPSAYNYYKNVYKGFQNSAWNQILTNKNVESEYLKWNKIINNYKKAFPIIFMM